MIAEAMLLGICTVLALCITLARVMPMRYILGYASIIDVAFSALMLVFFMNTFKGAMMAVLAGLMLAVFLTIGRKLFGHSRLRVHRHGAFTYALEEVRTPAQWAVWSRSALRALIRLRRAARQAKITWPRKPHGDWEYYARASKS